MTPDLALFRRARRALAAIRAAGGVMAVERFFALIHGFQEQERLLFQSFVEIEEGLATLSPLAFVLSSIESTRPDALWISPQVADKLQSATGTEKKRLEAFLVRFTNPLWRSSYAHPFPNCELPVFGRNSLMFRLAAHFNNDNLYVCRLFDDHDIYERSLNGLKFKDVSNFSDYQKWTLPVTEDELEDEEQSEIELLRAELAAMPARLGEELQAIRKENENLKIQLRNCRSEMLSAAKIFKYENKKRKKGEAGGSAPSKK